MKNKPLKIIVFSACGTYTAWFEGKPKVFGQASELGKAVWYLIEKGTLVVVEDYVDLGVVRANLDFQLRTGKLESAKDSAKVLGRKLTKKEEKKCKLAFDKNQNDIAAYWEKRRKGNAW